MRELKFRVWDKRNNHWLTPELCTMKLVPDGVKTPVVEIALKDVEISEFTGLQDANGVDIYEGDICEGRYGRFMVEFSNGGFYPLCGEINAPHAPEEVYKIIGNIYKNPELINQKG